MIKNTIKISIAIFLISFTNSILANTIEKDNRLNTNKNTSYLSPIENEILSEINLFRLNPAKYAEEYIAPLAKYYDKKILRYPNDKSIRTNEGISALNECVRVLKKATKQSIMKPSMVLSKAAKDHALDQAKTGETGHTGSDQSDLKERIERYGEWQLRIAENIAYGNSSARQVVIFLLIDDGVKNRGHRKNLLHPDYKTVGLSFGKHPIYSTMCVMDFAGGIAGE